MKLFVAFVPFYLGSSFKVLNPKDAQEAAEVTELKQCHTEEAERLARQRKEAGILGFFGDIVGGACGGVYAVTGNENAKKNKLIQEKQELSVQARVEANASQAFIFDLGCAIAEGTVGLAESAVSYAHEEENAGAQNCEHLAAILTLQKIDDLQKTTEAGGDCSGSGSQQNTIKEGFKRSDLQPGPQFSKPMRNIIFSRQVSKRSKT